ncbi:hypothetical protein GCM10010313_13290 [Streptomyces violarus]|nr:hypothetical protein GCM10010313_13290 [Streptomyces violarus]
MSANDHAFTGKAAFVTGAASGIGRATALAFARAGARVALADLSTEGLKESARLIREVGGQAAASTWPTTTPASRSRPATPPTNPPNASTASTPSTSAASGPP